nr:MAG TPA: hypothetical protein [Caudoviricetes sp.]
MGNNVRFALIRPCGATFPRWGRLGGAMTSIGPYREGTAGGVKDGT